MLFRGKKISEYSEMDIQSLIDNKVPENRILDYKRDIILNEQGKTELIYDISAFYNTDGGCLIIGLDEERDDQGRKTGIPKIPEKKINIENFDELILKIENIVRQSTNPQVTKLEFSNLLNIKGSHIFLIGIPKTRSLPSMVTYSNINRFYKRKSNGKYTLDTYELYETFLQMNTLENQIYDFISQRHEAINNNDVLPHIGKLNSLIIHTVPHASFTTRLENFSSQELKKFVAQTISIPGYGSFSLVYCLDGLLLFQKKEYESEYDIIPYNLIFRNAAIESFTNEPFFVRQKGEPPQVEGIQILKFIKEQLDKVVSFHQELSIENSFYLSITLNNVANMLLLENGRRLGRFKNQNMLRLPIVLYSSDSTVFKKQLKNQLDILWQSVGVSECSNQIFDQIFDSI